MKNYYALEREYKKGVVGSRENNIPKGIHW